MAAVNSEIKTCTQQINICQDALNWKRLSDTEALLAELREKGKLEFPRFGVIERRVESSLNSTNVYLILQFSKDFRKRLGILYYIISTMQQKHQPALGEIKTKFGFAGMDNSDSIYDFGFSKEDRDGSYYSNVASFDEYMHSVAIKITVRQIGAREMMIEFVKDPEALEEAMLKVLLQTVKEIIGA